MTLVECWGRISEGCWRGSVINLGLQTNIQRRTFCQLSLSSSNTLKMFFRLFCICSVTFVDAFSVLKSRGFDPTLQHVDVSGAHSFIAPTASDLRGPCPAMNAAANHGYIARNGYTTLQESRDASINVFGAGMQLVPRPMIRH